MVPPAPAISTEFLPAAFSRRTCRNMPDRHEISHNGTVHLRLLRGWCRCWHSPVLAVLALQMESSNENPRIFLPGSAAFLRAGAPMDWRIACGKG
jgi:hypothetical protein